MDKKWYTGITKVEPNNIQVRGYPIHYLMDKITFGEAVYLLLKGELPDEKEKRMIETILVSSIDHGPTPPSVIAARTVASTGSPLNASIAAGILAIYKYHGGAIEDAMKFFYDGVEKGGDYTIALQKVKQAKEQKRKIFGFGHRYHTKDPRTDKLFKIAEETGIKGKHIEFALHTKNALKEVLNKELPINVDGAIAAVLCEMNFPSEIGNAFFIISRLPGLIAHINEEKTREKPMRKIYLDLFEYDGPEREPFL